MWGPKGKGVAPKERGTTSQKGMGSREIEVSKKKGVVSEEQGPVEMWPLGVRLPVRSWHLCGATFSTHSGLLESLQQQLQKEPLLMVLTPLPTASPSTTHPYTARL